MATFPLMSRLMSTDYKPGECRVAGVGVHEEIVLLRFACSQSERYSIFAYYSDRAV